MSNAKSIAEMRDRLAYLNKIHAGTKAKLIQMRQKEVMRAMSQKLRKVTNDLESERNTTAKLKQMNNTLVRTEKALRRQLASQQKINDDLRGFIAQSICANVDINHDDFQVSFPTSPKHSQHHAAIDLTPKKIRNQKHVANSVSCILQFEEPLTYATRRKPLKRACKNIDVDNRSKKKIKA